MSSEAVKVIVRCRPLNEREINSQCKNITETDNDSGQCTISHPNDKKSPSKIFFFDGAFDYTCTTETIYNEIAYSLVDGVTEGYNGTIFAYGQTGCGKSFTMQGLQDNPTQRGIIPRAFDHIFETTSVSQTTKYLLHASYLEIYNEEIRDLLGRDVKAKLELKEHPEKGVYVAGLTLHKVVNVEDCQTIMNTGWKNRSTGATLMNTDSSRSHSIFTVFLEMVERDSNDGMEKLKAGKLNLVDLAGSERQAKTGAAGDRFKEATKINLSLSALGNVISALVDSKVKHIPYRDSKLTRLLQDSLGGNTKTLMIACLSPADNSYEETLSTLRYANRAKNIQNKPKINEDPKDTLLRQFQDEINRLRLLLENKSISGQPFEIANNTDIIMQEREQIRKEYESRLQIKEAQFTAEAADKANLMEEIKRLKELYDDKLSKLSIKSEEKLNILSDSTRGGRGHFTMKQDSTVKEDLRMNAPVSFVDQEGNLLNRKPIPESMNSKAHELLSLFPNQPPKAKERSAGESMLSFAKCSAKQSGEQKTKEELMSRLKLLESGLVGGEQACNAEAVAKQSRRRKHAEERKRRLINANYTLEEDDGIMVGIYENIQDELRHTGKLLRAEKMKNLSLQSEIKDIQSEFEMDRSDYLDTIRRQQRQIDLLQAIIDRIQPCVRRDSNYHNVDKIKRLAKYDEDSNEWNLPPMAIERIQLPVTTFDSSRSMLLGMAAAFKEEDRDDDSIGLTRLSYMKRDPEKENEDEARFYAKLTTRTNSQPSYFCNRRVNKLLHDAASTGSRLSRSYNGYPPQQYQPSIPVCNSESNTLRSPDNMLSNLNPLPGAFEEINQAASHLRRSSMAGMSERALDSPNLLYGNRQSPHHKNK